LDAERVVSCSLADVGGTPCDRSFRVNKAPHPRLGLGIAEGELLTVKKAAVALGVAPSTIHRLLNDGIIAGEQLTPGAPWRIRLTDALVTRFKGEAGDDFLPMRKAMRMLGVSRQTVLQRVKCGELEAVHIVRGKQKGLRIKVIDRQPALFSATSSARG
jgi:predicted DNA-binding transcriptional regulator AlpA